MKKSYNFSNAVKNPHAGKLKNGYKIVVEHKDYNEVITVIKTTKQDDVYNTKSSDLCIAVSEEIKDYKKE